MLTCISRPNQAEAIHHNESLNTKHSLNSLTNESLNTKHSLKSLTSQIKDIALKASGAYLNCSSCSGPLTQEPQKDCAESDSSTTSERLRWSYRRATSSNSRQWGKEMEARLKGISSSSGGRTPVSASSRRDDPVVFVEESEPKQWVAQVEPGVLITFVSMPRGGNDLKRICFSLAMFNKRQAQRWWAENYEKVMELYNVHRLNRQAFPLPFEDVSSKVERGDDCPVRPPLSKERHPCTMFKAKGAGLGYSSSDYESYQASASASVGTPKQSSINSSNEGGKMESSSMAASVRSSSSREEGDMGYVEREWIEEDESGVYITVRALPGGGKELRRVRFSREKFGEMQARLWWEENRARIHKQYL